MNWGGLARLCLANMAIGILAALPVNLFNRLMTVELALPAILPGLLVALHYAVQISRPLWGHRSDTKGGRTPFILGGIAVVGFGLILTAWGIAFAPNAALAISVWIIAYALIGFGIGAAGTSFLALLATAAPDDRKGAAATFAWLMLILGAVLGSIGTGQALKPYSPERLMMVVPIVAAIALMIAWLATLGTEPKIGAVPEPSQPNFKAAIAETWADPSARAFTGFVFLSILAFYLSELVLEPFAGHVHGLTPDASTKLSGGKDGASLLGMLLAGGLSTFGLGSLRNWAFIGCVISAIGLVGLSATLPILPFTLILGLGNGLFVVGAIGSMMRLASKNKGATGTRMGVFGAAQAIAAGIAGLIATGTVDLARFVLPVEGAYGVVFGLEAMLFLVAALMAARLLGDTRSPNLHKKEPYHV